MASCRTEHEFETSYMGCSAPSCGFSVFVRFGRKKKEEGRIIRELKLSEFEPLCFTVVPEKPKFSVAHCIQVDASAGSVKNSDRAGAYVLWPQPQVDGSLLARSSYFSGLEGTLPTQAGISERPAGPQAKNFAELLTIRAVHNNYFRSHSFGTAVGYRIRDAQLTDIPAIIVFVSRKLHPQWLMRGQVMPTYLQGPGGVWCDIDVVEFSYSGGPMVTPKEQIYNSQVEGLRGSANVIGSGSQVASHETYGTLGAIVRSKIRGKEVGFVTNRHVAVDLDQPYQKIFHPLPPNLGPGVYLGTVQRAASFITDDLWFGIFAGSCPDTAVRIDAAFVPFASTFDTSVITTAVGDMEVGELQEVDIEGAISEVIGKRVTKLGRSSGPTNGRVMAYGLQYSDEKGISFLTDFLIVGEDEKPFDLEGDSGSMVLIRPAEDGGKYKPLGMVWGGTSNQGRLKFSGGKVPVTWTSAIDLGRALDVLHLDILSSNEELQEALLEQEDSSTEDDVLLEQEDSSREDDRTPSRMRESSGKSSCEEETPVKKRRL